MIEDRLRNWAKDIRKSIIEVACKSKSAHVGSALSCTDLLVALYFHKLKNLDKKNWKRRDIFILSKAHAAIALYAVLTKKGLINQGQLYRYFQDDGSLPAHLDRFDSQGHLRKGIEVSAGALGHGFNMAIGMSYGYKLRGDKRKVYCLIGDGESQEGSVWEGALFGAKLKVDNLTVLLDFNNLQGYGRPTEICHFMPIAQKWKAFGWEPYQVDGHDFREIIDALQKPHRGKPKIIIAKTIKGKGVPFMENEMKWHYYMVTDELKEQAMQKLCALVK
ncbi:MAG: transketolase [Omnitrophica WOR_2 bacterium SM23_72]|nr:MAG: transketolase [Omnitrophica WOR_2 bacterium SM23_72]